MWYIKVKTFTRGDTWYFVSDEGYAQVSTTPLLADAFGPLDIERHRQIAAHVFGADRVELVECSTHKILTPEMIGALNL